MFSSIPLPKVVADVGPGGGLVTALQGINALTKSSLDNQIANAQAQYAPYQAFGNAYLTNQKAQWLPYQYKMQAISNPMLWIAAQHNPALAQQLADVMKSPFSGMGPGSFPTIPMPGQSSNPLGNGLFGYLYNKITGNGSQPNGAPAGSMPQQGQQNGSSQDFGANHPATDQGIDYIAEHGNSSFNGDNTTQSPSSPLPGTEKNPVFEAQQGGATAESQGKANVEQLKDLQDEASKGAVDAQNSLNDLDRFRNAYNNLKWYEKGYAFGSGPAMSSNAQIADQAANSMRTSVLKQYQQGHITNADFQIFSGLKPGRYLNEGSENAISNFMEGSNDRAQERAQFNNAAANKGLTAPQINLLWSRYINERPFFNAKTNELNQQNLNSWGDYLENNKMNSILNGTGNAGTSTSSSPPIEATKVLNKKTYVKINGKWYPQ